jgi:hypothetical protein
MSWEHLDVDILKKNVKDLQESLTIAHKRIAKLSLEKTNKVVALKSIREIVEKELVDE